MNLYCQLPDDRLVRSLRSCHISNFLVTIFLFYILYDLSHDYDVTPFYVPPSWRSEKRDVVRWCVAFSINSLTWFFWKIPSFCFMVGCSNDKKNSPELNFCRVPKIITTKVQKWRNCRAKEDVFGWPPLVAMIWPSRSTSMSISSDFKNVERLLWLCNHGNWVQMSCISIHSSYLWMFEVLEAKIIIFAENKQAEKKFLLKEFFNSATAETEFKFWKKFCTFICNWFSLASGWFLNGVVCEQLHFTDGESWQIRMHLKTPSGVLWCVEMIYGYFVHVLPSKLLCRCCNVFIRVFCFHLLQHFLVKPWKEPNKTLIVCMHLEQFVQSTWRFIKFCENTRMN